MKCTFLSFIRLCLCHTFLLFLVDKAGLKTLKKVFLLKQKFHFDTIELRMSYCQFRMSKLHVSLVTLVSLREIVNKIGYLINFVPRQDRKK